jgi:hypothetical protein
LEMWKSIRDEIGDTVKLGYVKLGYRKSSDILKLKIGFFRIARWGLTC